MRRYRDSPAVYGLARTRTAIRRRHDNVDDHLESTDSAKRAYTV